MLNRDHILVEIMTALKGFVSSNTPFSQMEEELKRLSAACDVQYEDIVQLYNSMSLFAMDVENMGGQEAYEKSEYVWLKSELELLLFSYKFFQKNGISIVVISDYLSKEKLSIFPKTKSQLQNTYYKIRNNQMPLENYTKQKPGRKPGQEYQKEYKQNAAKGKKAKAAEEQQMASYGETAEAYTKKNLVQLLSGMINNFQIICEHNIESEKQVYQLIEGIYELSSMAAESTKSTHSARTLETELELLRQETAQLKREKEDLIQDIRHMAEHISSFVESSDMEQLKGLSGFVATCRNDLHKLGLYTAANERSLKVFVDHTGQVVSVK
ncbi:MAG: DNA-binding domain-containing protein [Ectobacillus sp.]